MFKKSRNTASSFFTSSNELPDEWDDLLPKGHYLKRQQLAISEKSDLPNISYLYILVRQQGKAIAAISFQALKLKSAHLNNSMVKPYQSWLWNAFSVTAHPVLLVAGHLFRHDVCSCYWDERITAFDAFTLYRNAIADAIRYTCASAVLVKDVNEQLINYFQNYLPDYFMLRNDISMEMDIPAEWNGMTDYEKALKHKYAQRYRKIRHSWEAVSVKELSLAEVRDYKDELYKLYRQVTDRQQVRIGFLSPAYIVQLKEFYGEALKIWAAYEDGRMVAFFSAWIKHDVFDMFYIGFNYEDNARLQLYFNMLFFAVEQSILLRKQKLILGRTALDAKARLGCKPRYLHTFLYIKNSLVRNRVLTLQQTASDNEGEWEQRHPFKAS